MLKSHKLRPLYGSVVCGVHSMVAISTNRMSCGLWQNCSQMELQRSHETLEIKETARPLYGDCMVIVW